MTKTLQLGNKSLTPEEVINLLFRYQMVPQLLRESIIDQAIAPFSCTPEEIFHAYQQFCQKNHLISEIKLQAWLERYGMSRNHLEDLITRPISLQKFKQATFEHQLESYFLKRKSHMDRAVYSFLRINDSGIAQELFFRIQEREQTFAELAREYSQGPEALTGGIMGPVELGTLNPNLAKLLRVSQPGQLWPPQRSGEWQIIIRLEKFIPAMLDESIRQRLLHELFETWLHEQINQLGFVGP